MINYNYLGGLCRYKRREKERDSLPEELDEKTRRLAQLEIEREAIKRENDEEKLAQLNKDIAELQQEVSEYKSKWQREKELVNKIQQNKQLSKMPTRSTTRKLLMS